MNRIIFATGNAGKMKEIREILGDMDAEILKFLDRKSTRLNSSHVKRSRMPSSA